MSGTPQSAFNDLIGEVCRLGERPHPDEFALRRIENAARRLLSSDASGAYDVLGAVSALRGAIQDMRKFHANAIRLAPASAVRYRNFAVSLQKTGFFSEAAYQACRACDIDISEPDNVRSCARMLSYAGLFERADKMLGKLAKICPGEDRREHDVIRQTLGRLHEANLGQGATAALVDLACEAIHVHEVFRTMPYVRLITDDEGTRMLFDIQMPVDVARISAIADSFAELVVEADVDPAVASIFCIRFSKEKKTNVAATEGTA